MKLNKLYVVIIILIFIVAILSIRLIVNSKDTSINTDLSSYKKEISEKELIINNLQADLNRYKIQVDSALQKLDSLKNNKINIKKEYNEKYIFINRASNKLLDSIIRSNW